MSIRLDLIKITMLSPRPHDRQVDVQASTTSPATALAIDETGIAWQSDIKKKFGDQQVANFNVVPAVRGGGTVTGDDNHSTICTRSAHASFRSSAAMAAVLLLYCEQPTVLTDSMLSTSQDLSNLMNTSLSGCAPLSFQTSEGCGAS